ncbi:MAG: acyl-CoA/acyl-ACP dehydrogenase [Deltaproteobacteria bacterium]|nr:acyl-CoA/acyl-ACP dehydrogenase [Deltaproteobacteria bacterium]
MSFSDEQADIMKSAWEFCRKKSPISSVREQLETDNGFESSSWDKVTELGWIRATIPEENSGIGLKIGSVIPIAENMGRYMLSTPFFSSTLAAQAIVRAGTEAQKENRLPKMADGAIGTVALLDNEDWGSDAIICNAENEGDKLILTGTKWFVTDAEVAELFVVSVNYQDAPAFVIVNRSQLAENAIARHTLIDETKRAFKVDFSGIVVEKSGLLDPAKSKAALRDLKLIGALLTAAEATGSAAAALDLTVDYLKIRKQFGKFIGSYQALKHPTVEVLNQMETARSHLYHAATIVGDEPLDTDMEIACRMAKALATDALLFAGDRAVQFHGGMGFTYECDAQLYIRRAQWCQQQFGDAYHHRKRLATLLFD